MKTGTCLSFLLSTERELSMTGRKKKGGGGTKFTGEHCFLSKMRPIKMYLSKNCWTDPTGGNQRLWPVSYRMLPYRASNERLVLILSTVLSHHRSGDKSDDRGPVVGRCCRCTADWFISSIAEPSSLFLVSLLRRVSSTSTMAVSARLCDHPDDISEYFCHFPSLLRPSLTSSQVAQRRAANSLLPLSLSARLIGQP